MEREQANQQYQQQISRLMDGDLSTVEQEQLFNLIATDKHAMKAWESYHLIRDTVCGRGLSASSGLSARIAESIEQLESHHLTESESVASPDTATVQTKSSAKPRNPVLRQHPSLYALAASVLVAVVLTYNPLSSNRSTNLVAENSSATANTIPVALDESIPALTTEELARMHGMLMAHGQFGSSPNLNGLVTYAKLVSERNTAAVENGTF